MNTESKKYEEMEPSKISSKMEETVEKGRAAAARASEMTRALKERTAEKARAAELYVQDNPWSAVSIAAGIGLVLGMILTRRRMYHEA